MRSLRIAHVIADVDEEAKGPSYSVVRTVEALAASDNEVGLFTLAAGSLASTVDVQVFPRWRIPWALGVSPSLRRAILTAFQGVDVIHSHGMWMMPNLYPAQGVRRGSGKWVVSPRGMLDQSALSISRRRKQVLWAVAQRRALTVADMFHATSEAEADAIRALGFEQPIAVVPNGVDIPELEPLERTPTVLYLGRIHRIKRLDRLVRAWRRVELRFPEWQLRIVGPAQDAAHLREVKALAEGSARVEISPPVYGRDKVREYQRAGLVVLPTDTENFGQVVAEALAAGTPVIVTKGAPWSGLEDEGCGWWVEPTVEGVETALDQAMTLGLAKLGEMGTLGRSWMARDFSWESVARQLQSSYETLLEHR